MSNEQNQIPGVTDKRVTPPGILPRNIQTLVLGGVALVMVIVILFSGRSSPKPSNQAIPGAKSAIRPPNEDKLKEYPQRLEEEARKLAKEQAELIRAKNALAGVASSQVPRSGYGGVGAYPSDGMTSDPTTRRWVQEEKEKREYLSRFASNVALSLRSDPKPANSDASIPLPQAPPAIDPRLYPWPLFPQTPETLPQTGELPTTGGVSSGNAKPPDRPERNSKNAQPDLNRSIGKEYRLFEGTIIETVLTNRLDGTFSGPVNCMVSYDVYSHDRNHILIPSGSRVLGDVHPVESAGQQRLAVTFHRLITPDGFSVSLDEFHGLSQVGETGLRDQVNHHYLQIFGASIAIGMIAGLAQSNTQYGATTSGTDAYRQGVAGSLSQSSLHILDRFLNILPTFTIREGQRIKIYLNADLALPAYENHDMPGDI